MALNHLESIPEKQCLMEDFKDLEVGHPDTWNDGFVFGI